ncbi:flavodoxin domain-containing protein [Rhodosalinus sp. FB01]|uniref:flavodoxin domain-containing protein n=1 Tax=Rhodosalinus sp. FB01 TaxID=3239194 RepID=UPI003525A244
MRLLIVYATTEGQTRKIARFCADRLSQSGHSVELLPAADAEGIDWPRIAGAILAGSVHMGRVQEGLERFAAAHAVDLGARPSLFLQVSLAAAGDDPEERADIERIAGDFCARTGWQPDRTLQVAGAFRFTQYDFFRRWAMRWIASQKGERIRPGEDREYTDWTELADALDAWLAATSEREETAK